MHLFNFSGRVAGACVLTLLTTHLSGTPAKAQLPTSGSLTVEIAGLQNTDGQVCFSVFDSSAGFPDEAEAVIAKQCISADGSVDIGETTEGGAAESESASPLSVTFSDLSMGTYAVSVLHDENGDDQINQGTFGIPTEGFGFSRNPTVTTGAPEFYETAVFVFGTTTTQIEMIYF